MFTAHLRETIKHLTRYKQKVVLAAMLEAAGLFRGWGVAAGGWRVTGGG